MKPKIYRAEMHVQSDRGFEAVGEGKRRFIYWQGEYHDYLFYTPRLLLVKTNHKAIQELKGTTVVEMADNEKQARLNAINQNRDFARKGKYWDGGEVAEEVIALLQGKTVSERVFAQHAGPTKPFAQFDNRKEDKVAEGWTIAEKDRVYIFGDPEKIGTVVKVGDEVSAVKWDDGGEGNVTNTNLRRVKSDAVDKAQKAKSKAEAKAAAKAEKEKAKSEKKAAKAKEKPAKEKPAKEKATKAPPARKANLPEGRIILKPDKWATKDNPRKAGTKANSRCGEMIAYVKKNPKAEPQEIIAKTSYRVDDLHYDIAHKFIEVKK